VDVLFVNPGNSRQIYQDLADDYSAIETPTWSLLLAQSCRSVGYSVGILDALAERLTNEQAAKRIKEINPRLICFVVYGQNPNSGTVNMSGVVKMAAEIKKLGNKNPIGIVGSHAQALPLEILETEKDIDIVFTNEAVYSLWNILKVDISDKEQIKNVKGIGFLKDGKPFLTLPETIVPQEKMDEHLPGYAWDLLPYKDKPLDLYRAHFWHAEYDHDRRTPFAAIYTSLGCMFKCSFCMINVINRDDNEPIGVASNYAKMRFWSPDFIIKEFDKLVEMGVRTLRISDEMFLLNRKYYTALCKLLIERGYGEILSMWAYSRIDTATKPKMLELVRKAGVKWLCLGIESADQKVRLEVTKGKFKDIDIRDVVQGVHDADIEIMANYLVGLPGDTHETMKKTLDLSVELCTLGWNLYAAMALPGSRLYKDAVDAGLDLPKDYSGYSFHSYDTLPLPTDELSPAEILKFRDDAWLKYHTYEPFLEKIEKKYGKIARENIEEMSKITLKRKILGD
jgi:anaerobic magnesium-protoporphyrin IX monomethyl ester cyclase